MPDETSFVDRLKKGIERIDADPPQGPDAEAMAPLRKSLVRTLARLAAGPGAPAATFRYQVTGGKNLLFQGLEALPVEPARLHQLLNAVGADLTAGCFRRRPGHERPGSIRIPSHPAPAGGPADDGIPPSAMPAYRAPSCTSMCTPRGTEYLR